MNKMVLAIAAVAALFAADALAKCCPRERNCERHCESRCHRTCDVKVECNPVQPTAEPAVPKCIVPCVEYRQVPAIRHVSYTCPTACLTEATYAGHVEKIKAYHDNEGIKVEVREM